MPIVNLLFSLFSVRYIINRKTNPPPELCRKSPVLCRKSPPASAAYPRPLAEDMPPGLCRKSPPPIRAPASRSAPASASVPPPLCGRKWKNPPYKLTKLWVAANRSSAPRELQYLLPRRPGRKTGGGGAAAALRVLCCCSLWRRKSASHDKKCPACSSSSHREQEKRKALRGLRAASGLPRG